MLERIDAVVIGAGQAGLAASHELSARGIEHVVLERGVVGHTWRTRRWRSFRIVSPNSLNLLPGYEYDGPEPDAFLDTAGLLAYLEGYAASFGAPVRTGISVVEIRRADGRGYRVKMDGSQLEADHVVVATGERLAGFPFNRVSNFLPNGVTPDGSKLVATVSEGPGGSNRADLWIVPLIGDHQPAPLLQSSSVERNGEISPDGRWIAYESLETGRSEIYVRPFPSVTAGKWPVSTGGGSQPAWSRNGRELLFLATSGALMSVSVGRGSPPAFGSPAMILHGPYTWLLPTYGGRQYDVAPDGRFLFMKPSASSDQTDVSTSITVVQNWTEELKRMVPTK